MDYTNYSELLGLRNDVYRRPLITALERLELGLGWKCADVGAGSGDVAVALAELVGENGRIYAIDSNPLARDVVAKAAAKIGRSQVIAITQAGEDLRLPELIDLAYCRFLLLHVADPQKVIEAMSKSVKNDGYVVIQEPITSAGRIGGSPFAMLDARHPDIGAFLPKLILDSGLELLDAWAEAPAWAGKGPVSAYLESLTEVDPGDESIVLPPLVTVIAKKHA